MPRSLLSEAGVSALRPQARTYDIRDSKLRGFGVRVLPSGAKRFFIHTQHCRKRVFKIVADADATAVDEARACAASMLAIIRGDAEASAPRHDTLFEAVADAVFQQHARVWKASTLTVNRGYLRRQLLPWFAGRQIADIDRRDVRRWFSSLRATPVAADRAAPVLSVIFREAELLGYRPEGSNPCRGLKRYRRKGRERHLTDEEIRRLAAALAAHEARYPLPVAALRLLLLTGCRKNEIHTLRWIDYREGHLFLRDSKTGPRIVWLSRAARKILEGLDRTGPWIFPGRGGKRPPPRMSLDRFWWRIRDDVNLSDVRLHDFRHTYASFGLRQGESILAIGRLLGHADPQTTLKYTHLADAMVREAAVTVGAVLEG